MVNFKIFWNINWIWVTSNSPLPVWKGSSLFIVGMCNCKFCPFFSYDYAFFCNTSFTLLQTHSVISLRSCRKFAQDFTRIWGFLFFPNHCFKLGCIFDDDLDREIKSRTHHTKLPLTETILRCDFFHERMNSNTKPYFLASCPHIS